MQMSVIMRLVSVFDLFKVNQQFRASKSLSHIPTLAGVFLGLAVVIVTIIYSSQRFEVLVNRKATNLQ